MTTSVEASGSAGGGGMGAEDVALLAGVGRGDERAMAALYDRHAGVVYSVALRVGGEAAEAEAVLQTVFMQLWLAPGSVEMGAGGLGGRLGVLARDVAIERMRGRTLRGEGVGTGFDPVSHAEVGRLMQRPHALVLLLPDADRRVLEMAFFEGKTAAEIAGETGVAAETIAGRVRGALAGVRQGAGGVDEETGLEVRDLDTHAEFAERRSQGRDLATQMEGLRRLTHSFLEHPETILQELVNAAVELCGADSAGISLERDEKTDANFYHWVATAGQYNGFLNAELPRYPSACGVCLERGRPQLFRVGQRFFDIMGIEAPLVTDGILLPWEVEGARGTIFIMAHGRTAAFDKEDGQMMRVLADFAAMAVRHQRQQEALVRKATAATAVAVANQLAHRINNPLQSLMNIAFLAAEGQGDYDVRTLGMELSTDLRKLTVLVSESLAVMGEGETGS